MPTPRLPGRRLAALAVLLVLCSCQGARPDGTVGETLPAPANAVGPEVVGSVGSVAGQARAEVDLGVYANDGRVVTLAITWSDLVDQALGRLAATTGLAFPANVAPRVVLTPLGDEDAAWRIDGEVDQGRRIPVLRVNVEPLATGRRQAETVLVRGLAAAVYEEAVHRRGATPPYVVRAASIQAAGDLEEALRRLPRRTAGRSVPEVDPDSPKAARATALAALLVLRDAGGDAAVRRFLAFTAEGDDPEPMLARAVQDPLGRWAGPGRERLTAALERVDVSSWRLLAQARRTLEEAGLRAMESLLPAALPPEIVPEITVLRAQARANEGDFVNARRLLETLDGPALAQLEDPGRASALRLRAVRAGGDDPELADRLQAEWGRDYPRLAVQLGARAETPGGGTRTSGLAVVQAHVQALLDAHKAGAARRLLDGLGDRGLAPELAAVQRAVVDAQALPSPVAIEVNRHRVRAWLEKPHPDGAAAVRDGGVAGAIALAEVLPPHAGTVRRQAVRLLGETAGPGRTVELLGPAWERQPVLLPDDLDTLLAVATWPELKVWVEGVARSVLGAQTVWARLRYDLDEAWVRENPDVLRDLRSDAYPVRRQAFDRTLDEGHATPMLIAHGLRDPAPLMRRAAIEAAGLEGYPALVRLGFEDEAWMVRQAASGAAARALGAEAVPLLLGRFRSDASVQVRMAATGTLFDLEALGPGVLEALVAALDDENPGIRELVGVRLPRLDPRRVVPVVVDALEAEARRAVPRVPFLARLFLVLQRSTGRRIAYAPGMTLAEIRGLVEEIRTWVPRTP